MAEHYTTEMEREIAAVLNKYSQEQESGTPDYILARYLARCLDVFNETMIDRSGWLGKDVEDKDPYLEVMESMDEPGPEPTKELWTEKEPRVSVPVTFDGTVVGMASVNPETGIGEATIFSDVSDVLSSKLVGGLSIREMDVVSAYPDAEPLPTHEHQPVQHRDGKVPWCNECELDKDYNKPASKLPKGPGAGFNPRGSGQITIHNVPNAPGDPNIALLNRLGSVPRRIPNG